MKTKDKPKKEKDKKIILWEVNSFPAIEIKGDKRLAENHYYLRDIKLLDF